MKFDIPSMLFISDKYSNTFHKFLLNIFSIFEGGSGNQATLAPSTIESLEIYSKNFTFNSRSNPYIKEIIKFSRVKENLIINNLVLDLKFNKIENILNLIPKNVQFLNLSEFDDYTFSSFISEMNNFSGREKNNLHKNCEKIEYFFENLNTLHISLSHSLHKIAREDKLNLILEFFKIKFSKNLKQIIFNISKLAINETHLGSIIHIINKFSRYNPNLSLYNIIISSNFIDPDLIREKEKKIKVLGESNYNTLYPLIFSINFFKLKIQNNKNEYREKYHSSALKHAFTLIDLFLRKKSEKVIKLEFI